MKASIIIPIILLACPALGQTIYKCPDPSGVVKFSQVPCQGSEAITINVTRSGVDGLRDSERAYLEDRDKARQQADKPEKSARSSEVDKECFDMKRQIAELEEREARGIHTWSKHGYEESHWRRKEYDDLCR
jgi:hypothetical protein